MKKHHKKQKIILLTLCIAVVIYSNVSAIAAFDSDETKVNIEFKAGNGPTYPVDPENPKNTDEGEDGENGIYGDFAIVSVSNFSFSNVENVFEIKSEEMTYDIVTPQPNIQIVDLRGTGTGWTLKANLSEFRNDYGPSMPGAFIEFDTARPNSVINTDAYPKAIEHVKLHAGDANSIPVIVAGDNSGMGQWVMRWYPPINEENTSVYIHLNVPVASIGTNTATINWILIDTP